MMMVVFGRRWCDFLKMRCPSPPARALTDQSGLQHQRGFTLVELVVVVFIVAILAAIAIPNMKSALMKARAAEAVGDLRVVRQAVYDYLGDKHVWPPDAGGGMVPTGLAPYLPEGWSMTKADYMLNFEPLPNGPVPFIAVAVQTTDADLGSHVLNLLGSNAWLSGSDRYMWAFEWLD